MNAIKNLINNPNPIEAILFDMDGVIVPSDKDIDEAANYALRKLGLPEAPKEKLMHTYTGGTQRRFEFLIKDSPGKAEQVKLAVVLYRDYSVNVISKRSLLYPGVAETIPILGESGYKLGVQSTKITPVTKNIFENHGLLQYFVPDAIMGNDIAIKSKADHKQITLASEAMQTDPKNILVVGDSDVDILIAKDAGAQSMGVTYGIGNRQNMLDTKPDFLIDSFSQILTYVPDRRPPQHMQEKTQDNLRKT